MFDKQLCEEIDETVNQILMTILLIIGILLICYSCFILYNGSKLLSIGIFTILTIGLNYNFTSIQFLVLFIIFIFIITIIGKWYKSSNKTEILCMLAKCCCQCLCNCCCCSCKIISYCCRIPMVTSYFMVLIIFVFLLQRYVELSWWIGKQERIDLSICMQPLTGTRSC